MQSLFLYDDKAAKTGLRFAVARSNEHHHFTSQKQNGKKNFITDFFLGNGEKYATCIEIRVAEKGLFQRIRAERMKKYRSLFTRFISDKPKNPPGQIYADARTFFSVRDGVIWTRKKT